MEEYSSNYSDSLCPNNEGQPKSKVNIAGPVDQDVYREMEYEGFLSKKPVMDTKYEGETPEMTQI